MPNSLHPSHCFYINSHGTDISFPLLTDFQVGFNKGDHVHYFALPESRTPAIVNVQTSSNMEPPVAGRHVYLISDLEIEAAAPTPAGINNNPGK